jgi:hypothetical protein
MNSSQPYAEDPYLNPSVARSLHEALPTSDLSLLPKKALAPTGRCP